MNRFPDSVAKQIVGMTMMTRGGNHAGAMRVCIEIYLKYGQEMLDLVGKVGGGYLAIWTAYQEAGEDIDQMLRKLLVSDT